MKIHLDRHQLFAVLIAFEEDLRAVIERHLLVTHYEEQVLGPAHARAVARLAKDEQRDVTQTNVIDYLDLGDELEILNRWRRDLPAQTQDALSRLSGRLAELVQIRNRVVHGRPLLTDDFEKVRELLTQLDNDGFEGSSLRQALQHLRDDPDWTPTRQQTTEDARTLNNLPLGDYDETGLVGRRRDLERLTQRLLELGSSRSPVLTVIGPGGVGKTALALQALHDLVNDDECPYELVSWVSLKTEHLTARGVQAIQDAVFSVEQAVPALIEALEPSFDGTASQLADSLDGLSTLIVIDNLETATGREVMDLIDTLPDSVSYLLTSRQGLGELERRVPLKPLEDKYAVDLLRRLARARELEPFAQINQEVAQGLVRQLGASPLGLKWFISSIELGKDPEELVSHRDDFVRYCVENVYKTLNDDARTVCRTLNLLAQPVTIQELHLYVPDIPPDGLRSAIQALDRRMLISKNLTSGSISETFETTGALSDYLDLAEEVDANETRRIREAEDEFRLADERHRLDSATDPLRPNIIQGGNEHRASVLRLRNAMAQSKRGELTNALDEIRAAEHLDPEFWEIHRVRGFILSSAGRVQEATTAYLRAIELAPSDRATAAVKYFFAGHLTRAARDATRAVSVAKEAHEVLRSPKTAIELGRALTYVAEYANAESVLREAIEADDIRTRLIAVTQLADCMKRRAETEGLADRQPLDAIATLADAINIGYQSIEQGLIDRKLGDKIVDLSSELLKLASMCREVNSVASSIDRALIAVRRLGHDARQSRSFGYLLGHAHRLSTRHPELVSAIPILQTFLPESVDSTVEEGISTIKHQSSLLGTIKAWKADRHFGFIAGLDRGEDFYFNRASLASAADEIYLASGTTIRFRTVGGSEDRQQAQDVSIEGADDDILRDRRATVDWIHSSGHYLFSTDMTSGATVFVGRHASRNQADWHHIEPGMCLDLDVEIDEEGRFSAASRSARIVLDADS